MQMASRRTRKHSNVTKRFQAYVLNLFNSETKDAVELVFTIMTIFMVTCLGSMLMICFFFEMDRRSSSPPTEIPRSPTLPSKRPML